MRVSRNPSFDIRRAHSWNRSPSRRSAPNRSKRRTNASGTSVAGLAPSTQSMKAASRPRLPPSPMSTASTIASAVLAVSPRNPMSAICGCAHEAEHPEKCMRTISPSRLTRRSSSRAHSTARAFVSTMARRQNSLPVQATAPRSNGFGCGEWVSNNGSLSSPSSIASVTPVKTKF